MILRAQEEKIALRYAELQPAFAQWEKLKDMIDQLIDIILNYRQSGHPGGSRSKVHALVTLLLSGIMRWDIRQPSKRFSDRFILVAGHNVPLVYCTLAVFNEALRLKYAQTGAQRYRPAPPEMALFWQDLLGWRRRGGLSGHAEMEGKTLLIKYNTGPSGHGSPAAVGEALALKRAGADGVKVFALEGDAGLTPGAAHESMNSAWAMALDNLYYIVDWNDYGIDEHPLSATVPGTPRDWFAPHGWRVFGAEFGSEWGPVAQALLGMVLSDNPERRPSVAWLKTRKGRQYLRCDYQSHGTPHHMNCPDFWRTKAGFAEQYGVRFAGMGQPAPEDPTALQAQFRANLQAVMQVLQQDQGLLDCLADTLVAIGDSVPQDIPSFRLGRRGNPFQDERLYDFGSYPAAMYLPPGERAANRHALRRWGAWVNSFGRQEYGRPLFLACSADLAESTHIIGFAEGWEESSGYGWYERYGSSEGVMLPQEITEFTNAGLLTGVAAVNLDPEPESRFDGFWGACSTYGSFAYLKYGPLRLFSQMAQDCQLRLGKVLWVVSHSGPETADDSRTHFGILAPGVSQLFPWGQIINLHPWEHNEVPVVLGAALRQDVPIVALHLTRPAIEIPDRKALGLPSHLAAARGAYIARDYRPDQPRLGTIIVQGTSAMVSLCQVLPELDRRELNVKVVTATSPQLFALQPAAYRREVLSPADWADSTVVTTQARWLMHDWLRNPLAEAYALSADWDDRWRSGGTLAEVLEEAHLSPEWLLQGIERFARERSQRLRRLQDMVQGALRE
ncbi:MAG: transketolase [Chloroflexia bacterium]|nr:transketolase [Chloroflexia bacterium]